METIEMLLEKYDAGETTLAEERQLKAFFAQAGHLPPHLALYREQFAIFAEWRQEAPLGPAFDARLEARLQPAAQTMPLRPRLVSWQWAAGLAAGVALFVIGFYSGRQPQTAAVQLADLQGEMKKLRETVVMAQLRQSSASERIKGVNYVYDMQENSPEVIDALIETMNEDENTNVRLAAANALFTFKDVPAARNALIGSIRTQTDPSVKIALINIMIALKDKKTRPVIEEFLRKEPMPAQVRESIRKELRAI